jgi:hypothetical protein
MRLALAALAMLAAAAPNAAGAGPALAEVARVLADEVGPPAEGRRALALSVAGAGRLAGPLAAALERALSERGYAVTPERSADPEAAARAAGQDWLLRVEAGLVPGRRELALVGELVPTWPSFFLQRHPAARAIPPRLVSARAAADGEVLVLARGTRPPGEPVAIVRPLGTVPGRVLALAVGEAVSPGPPAIAAALPDAVVVLSPAGAPLARRALDVAGWTPVRAPAATIAIGDFGGGRVAVAYAGAPAAEVLAVRGGALEPAGTLEAAPLSAGGAGPVFGRWAPGTSVLADAVAARPDPDAPARSERTLYAVAAAPQGGPIAYAALGTDLRLELLGPELRVLSPSPSAASAGPPPRTGSAFALADLEGDGTAELVASLPARGGGEDAVRVHRLGAGTAGGAPLLDVPLEGTVTAIAGGDLTGDGVDDAVCAVLVGGGAAPLATRLLLVTGDPREGT